MAGSGGTHSAANKIERLAFPNCFTVPTFLTEVDRESLDQPLDSPTRIMPGPNFYLRLFSASTNILKNCSLLPRAANLALPLQLSLHPANQSEAPLIRCNLGSLGTLLRL